MTQPDTPVRTLLLTTDFEATGPQPGPLPQPRPFADYELFALIARDGPAVFWAAHDKKLDRWVTLKFLNGGGVPLAEQERRLRREAAAAAAVSHAGVVPVFEAGVWDGQPFLSLPRIEGEPLSIRLQRGPLPARVAADVLRQLAETLHSVHRANVLHGNLNPSHVWIDAGNRVRLTGFGTDEPPDEQTTQAGYLAPERARGASVRPVTDVYGLGAVLYAMLTGRPPHQAATVAGTLALIAQAPPVAPSRLNPRAAGDLETICLRCLRHGRGGTYERSRALVPLIADLRRFLSGLPVRGSRRRKPLKETGRGLMRQARALLAAAAVLAVVAALGLWDGYRDDAAWRAVARADASPAEHAWALRHFERRHADWPESSETKAGLALALARSGRLSEAAALVQWQVSSSGFEENTREPVNGFQVTWRGDGSGWQQTQLKTLALIALRQRREGRARALFGRSSHSSGSAAETMPGSVEVLLDRELEAALNARNP